MEIFNDIMSALLVVWGIVMFISIIYAIVITHMPDDDNGRPNEM